MVAISETRDAQHDPAIAIPGHATSGIMGAVGGAALLIAAIGLWLWPGASWDPLLMLVKLGLSLFLLCGGMMFLMAARRPSHPEVRLDARRGCLRLIERDAGAVIREIEISYDDLSEVDLRDGMLIARDHHGQAVVAMPVEHSGDIDAIRAALGPGFARAA